MSDAPNEPVDDSTPDVPEPEEAAEPDTPDERDTEQPDDEPRRFIDPDTVK